MRLLALLLLAFAVPATAAEPGRLEVRGKELLSDGKPIRLRGVSVGDPFRDRILRNGSDYEAIATDWKANVVRLSVHPHTWKTMRKERVLDGLAAEVEPALKNGLFVIITYATIGWPDGHHEIPAHGGPADLFDSDFKLALSFWDAVAAKWGKDGRVIFELWNEAIYGKEDWRPEVGPRWSELKPYHEKLLKAVRKHGDNVVLVSGNHWSYLLTGARKDLLEGKNVAYSWHIYAGQYKNDTKKWESALDELQTVAPVVVSEWGFQPDTTRHYRGTVDDFGRPFVRDFLEGKGLHSVAWCWHPEIGPPLVKFDWKTPTEYGKFVRDYLRWYNK
jgi:endoglucanase